MLGTISKIVSKLNENLANPFFWISQNVKIVIEQRKNKKVFIQHILNLYAFIINK